MQQTVQGAFHLFTFRHISVFLHWSWFLLLAWLLHVTDMRQPLWSVVALLVAFALVTLHEFGHALACRSVGGVANRIVLWPLGGIAFVMPPQRPGAVLWSIAAGPLVNLVLLPVTLGLWYLAQAYAAVLPPELVSLATWTMKANMVLLVFNLLPIYPLDGGQIVYALLWFVVGRTRALIGAAWIGIAGGALGLAYAVATRELLLGMIAAFVTWQAYGAYQMAKTMPR